MVPVVPVARGQMKSPLGWLMWVFRAAPVTVAKVSFHTAALEIALTVAKSHSPSSSPGTEATRRTHAIPHVQ